MMIRTVREAINAFESQTQIGMLFNPPISQQAVHEWLKKDRVPAERVYKITRELRRLGHTVAEETFASSYAE